MKMMIVDAEEATGTVTDGWKPVTWCPLDFVCMSVCDVPAL